MSSIGPCVKKRFLLIYGIGKKLEDQGDIKKLYKKLVDSLPNEQDVSVRERTISVILDMGRMLENKDDVNNLCRKLVSIIIKNEIHENEHIEIISVLDNMISIYEKKMSKEVLDKINSAIRKFGDKQTMFKLNKELSDKQITIDIALDKRYLVLYNNEQVSNK